jgi:hypothetical protein
MKSDTKEKIRGIVKEIMRGKVENFIESIYADNRCRDDVYDALCEVQIDSEEIDKIEYDLVNGSNGDIIDGERISNELTVSLTNSFMNRFI